MASATKSDPGPPFDAGRALALSLALLASHAGAIALLTVLIHLPTLGYQLFLLASPTIPVPVDAAAAAALSPEAMHALQRQAAILGGATMFLTALSTTAVIHRVLQQIQGKPLRFADSLRFGVARTGAVMMISFITLAAGILGGFAFVLPGLVAVTVLFVAAPVAVAEGRGVVDSLRRSVELTRGSRWGVFALLVLPFALAAGLTFAALLAFGDLKSDNPIGNPRFQAVSAVISVLYQALTSVTATVAYLELRRREGVPAPLAPQPD